MNLYYAKGTTIQEKVDSYKNKRKEFKNNNLKYLMLLERRSLNECSVQDVWDSIKPYTKCKLKPSDIVFAFYNDFKKKTFSKKELKNLTKLTEVYKSMGLTVGVYDYEDVYDYHQVFNADKKIKEYANEIKKNDYSPLEKLMHAYFITQNREYKFQNKDESSSKSSSVYGILNSDKIVCVGYSELLKSIIHEIDDENVKVFANLVGLKNLASKDEKYSFHQNNIVYIKDDKYKIDGYYYLDPTWDYNVKSVDNEKVVQRDKLSHFLIEISQIKNIIKKDFVYDYMKGVVESFKLESAKKTNSKTKKLKNSKNYINCNFPLYTSVSSKEVNFNSEIFYNEDEYSSGVLNFYLKNRKDYQEYLALEQTEKFASTTKDFEKTLNKNLLRAEKEPNKMSVSKDSELVWKYFNQHSPHITIDVIQNALNVVLQKRNLTETKDKVSKIAHLTLRDNVYDSKQRFTQDSNTAFTEIATLNK